MDNKYRVPFYLEDDGDGDGDGDAAGEPDSVAGGAVGRCRLNTSG